MNYVKIIKQYDITYSVTVE